MNSPATNTRQPSTSKLTSVTVGNKNSRSQVFVIPPNELAKLGFSTKIQSVIQSQDRCKKIPLEKEKLLSMIDQQSLNKESVENSLENSSTHIKVPRLCNVANIGKVKESVNNPITDKAHKNKEHAVVKDNVKNINRVSDKMLSQESSDAMKCKLYSLLKWRPKINNEPFVLNSQEAQSTFKKRVIVGRYNNQFNVNIENTISLTPSSNKNLTGDIKTTCASLDQQENLESTSCLKSPQCTSNFSNELPLHSTPSVTEGAALSDTEIEIIKEAAVDLTLPSEGVSHISITDIDEIPSGLKQLKKHVAVVETNNVVKEELSSSVVKRSDIKAVPTFITSSIITGKTNCSLSNSNTKRGISPLKVSKLEIVSNEIVNFSPMEIQNILKSNIPYFNKRVASLKKITLQKSVKTEETINKTAHLPKLTNNPHATSIIMDKHFKKKLYETFHVTDNDSIEQSCEKQTETADNSCSRIINLESTPEDSTESGCQKSVSHSETLNVLRKESISNLIGKLDKSDTTYLKEKKEIKVQILRQKAVGAGIKVKKIKKETKGNSASVTDAVLEDIEIKFQDVNKQHYAKTYVRSRFLKNANDIIDFQEESQLKGGVEIISDRILASESEDSKLNVKLTCEVQNNAIKQFDTCVSSQICDIVNENFMSPTLEDIKITKEIKGSDIIECDIKNVKHSKTLLKKSEYVNKSKYSDEANQTPEASAANLCVDKPAPKKRGRKKKLIVTTDNTEVQKNKFEESNKTYHLSANQEASERNKAASEPSPNKKVRNEKTDRKSEDLNIIPSSKIKLEGTNVYVNSKTSGRKRKFVNYSELSGNTINYTNSSLEDIQPKRRNLLRSAKMNTAVNEDNYNRECENNTNNSKNASHDKDLLAKPTDDSEMRSTFNVKKRRGRKRKVIEMETTKPIALDESDQVTCGVCNDKLDKTNWLSHKERKHNNLAWKANDQPLDLDDEALVKKILTNFCKNKKLLHCEICGATKKSVASFLTHKSKCQKVSNNADEVENVQESHKKTAMSDILESLFSNIPISKKEQVPSSVLEKSLDAESTCVSDIHVSKPEANVAAEKEELPALAPNEVRCAVCKEVLVKGLWLTHKQKKHNNLAWREGDTPLDLNNRTLVMKILTDLYKSKKPLICETCGTAKKSVLGYLSHKSQCQKTETEIEALKVVCEMCGRSMLPVSLQRHMVLSHTLAVDVETSVPNVLLETSPQGKRKAASRAAGLIQDFAKDICNEKSSTSFKKYVKNVNFRSIEAAIYKFSEDIQKNSYAECVFNDCHFRTCEHEDLFYHIENCDKSSDTNYSCNFCLMTYNTRQSVMDHIKTLHNNNKNGAIILEFSSDNEFANDEEPDDNDNDDVYESDTEQSFRSGNNSFMSLSGVKQNRKTQSPITKASVAPGTHRILFLRKKSKASNCLYADAYQWMEQFCRENYVLQNIFPEICIRKDHWISLNPLLILSYLPKLKYSIDTARIKTNNIINPINYDYEWKRYKLFESDISDDGTSSIFCGGPVNAIAWVPTPYTKLDCDQILAISVLPDADKMYYTNAVHEGMGLIQFWNFGVLHNKLISTCQPKLEFCIAHNYGVIWAMEWCPSGWYDIVDRQEIDDFRKLGLLAVACSNNFVYIYAVIHPGQISGTVFKPKPVFRLQLENFTDLSVGENDYYSTRLSWTKAISHQFLSVGYSNGMVAIYNLKSQTSLLRAVDEGVIVLQPIQKFRPHLDAITALSLHHLHTGKRWLLTGSLDRDCKLWDLENVSEPISCWKKFIITDAVWLLHWLCSVYSYDHGCITGAVPTSVNPARECFSTCTSFMPSTSRVTSITANEWANLFIQANDCGEVICGFPDQLLQGYDCDKRKSIRKARCIASYTGVVAKSVSCRERIRIESMKVAALRNPLRKLITSKNTKKPLNQNCKNDTFFDEPKTYEEAQEQYGLVFCDMNMDYKLKEPSTELDKLLSSTHYFSVSKPDAYSLQSIIKIASNPNKKSFLYYACGYQVGFVRVSNIRFLCRQND